MNKQQPSSSPIKGVEKASNDFEKYMIDMIRLHQWEEVTDIYDHFDKKRTELREFMVNHIALFDNDWACDIVQNTCQLINGIKPDGVAEGWWSEWDESVLQSLIQLLKKLQLNYGKSDAAWHQSLSQQEGQHELKQERERAGKLMEAAERIIHLHACEQDGLSGGQPTPAEWFDATNKLAEEIHNYKNNQ